MKTANGTTSCQSNNYKVKCGESEKFNLKINFPDAKDLANTQTEAFVNQTETFETTGMLSIQPKLNETTTRVEEGGGVTLTTAHSFTPPMMTSPTATQLSTPLPQNRFFVPTDATDQHIAVPNDSHAASYNDATSTHSTKFNSTNNMTSNYDSSRNSSNTSFSIRFTTMKPCKRRFSFFSFPLFVDGKLFPCVSPTLKA